MTERLYYTEPARTEFDGHVVEASLDGARSIVELDRTAFYPSSGGQPHDTGRLGGLRVVDVQEIDDSRVAHVVEGTLEVGQSVSGSIDWARRLDHMQQHSGQHTLSAAFERSHGARTVGFHLGPDVSTIDLDRALGAEAVADAEGQANTIVWDDRPVTIRFVTAAEAALLPLRKAPARSGTLRLIDIDGTDLSACGGTHVARTGTIGMIVVTATERFRGGLRVSFLCGRRVLDGFRRQRALLGDSAKLFSGAASDLPAQIVKLQAEAKGQRRARRELSEFEAAELVAGARTIGSKAAVVAAVQAIDAGALKQLVGAIVAEPGRIAVLVSCRQPRLVVVARSGDVAQDMRVVLGRLTDRFGGRGGGQPELAQAGGLEGGEADVVAEAQRILAELA